MKKTESIFALTLCSVLALGTSAQADYVLRLKPRFGCPAGQIRYLGACILEANIPNQNNQGGNQGGNEGPGDNPGGNQGENPSTDPTTTCEVENCASCVTNQSNACDTCDDGYHTQNGECVANCTAGSCESGYTCNLETGACEEDEEPEPTCSIQNCVSCDENNINSCVRCEAGYYKRYTSETTFGCTACGDGTYAIEGSDDCTICPLNADCSSKTSFACNAGYTWNEEDNECSPCAIGKYKSTVGNGACETCTGGQTTASTGSTSANDCVAAAPACENGTIDDGTCYCNQGYTKDNGICVACEAGTYKDGSGNDVCMPCPNGTYSSGTANTGCTPCPNNADCSSKTGFSCNANYYANGSSCTPCPNNGTSPAGSTSASDCVAAAVAKIPCLDFYCPASTGWSCDQVQGRCWLADIGTCYPEVCSSYMSGNWIWMPSYQDGCYYHPALDPTETEMTVCSDYSSYGNLAQIDVYFREFRQVNNLQ